MAPDGKHILRRRFGAATAASVLLVAGGCGDDSRSPSARTSPAPATTTARPESGESRFRDGEYEAKGWYGGQPSSIDVALTLREDRITEVEVTTNATDPTSLDYQERFAGAVSDEVVGRPIEGLAVGRLSGSSTTPDGFNDALNKIRREAAR